MAPALAPDLRSNGPNSTIATAPIKYANRRTRASEASRTRSARAQPHGIRQRPPSLGRTVEHRHARRGPPPTLADSAAGDEAGRGCSASGDLEAPQDVLEVLADRADADIERESDLRVGSASRDVSKNVSLTVG